jgi:two-component system response regulator YesN
MNIVIADDETLVRISLISMITEMEASWDIAGEATDGGELVELVARYKPEAAIVDIRMPHMDGIEAIRKAKEISPKTKWIICSGYSDFQYAQKALQLGVTEYLLKPVNPNDLEKAINAISESNKEYRATLNQQFEHLMFSLFHGLITLEKEIADSLLRRGHFTGTVFYFDSALSTKELEAMKCEFSLAIRHYMQQHLVQGANLALLTLASGECVTVGVWDSDKWEAQAQIAAYMKGLERIMAQFRSNKMAITAIQTEDCRDFAAFLEQIGQIQKLAGVRSVRGLNRKWLLNDLLGYSLPAADMKLGLKLVQLASDYKNNLYMNYQKTLEDLEVLLSKGSADLIAEGVLSRIQRYLIIMLPLTLQDRNPKTWMQPLRSIGEALLTQNHSEQPSMDVVDYVVANIEMNYMNNIGIGQIAGELNITSSYLSKLFHKKTGTTFVKYLTRVRILKAKELLMESNLQIQQVAEQVGYYSTRHFTKLFTEAVGVYPSDFKRSMMLK